MVDYPNNQKLQTGQKTVTESLQGVNVNIYGARG